MRTDHRVSPVHRTRLLGAVLLAACTALTAGSALSVGQRAAGWRRGGQVIRVTTLAEKGPGSFLDALSAKGPRVIVFEVGGGEAAPNSGITF